MAEGDAAGKKLSAAGFDLVVIAVSPGEISQNVEHDPGIVLQLPEGLIDGEVEGVHHAILALVDDPERLAGDVEQLSIAVISARGVGDEKLLIGAEARIQKLRVQCGGSGEISVERRSAEESDVVEAGEDPGVKVSAFKVGGDDAIEVNPDGQDQVRFGSGGDFHGEARASSQGMDGIHIGDALGDRPALKGEKPGGVVVMIRLDRAQHAHAALPGETDGAGASRCSPCRTCARINEVQREDGRFG